MQSTEHRASAAPSWLTDPDALDIAWRAVIAKNHHLHGPDAAALLGVPEAALLACRVGRGATCMATDLVQLLAPVANWGKVLVAARNRLGVALSIMDDAAFSAAGSLVTLQTPQHRAVLAAEGLAACYLFEENDAHGHTVSLNWFDGRGDVIGRLFLMSKSGREMAMPWLMHRAEVAQERTWTTKPLPAPAVPDIVPTASSHALAKGEAAGAMAMAAVLACHGVSGIDVTMEGPGASVRYSGPLAKAWQTGAAAHASDAGCKLHLRPPMAQEVTRCAVDDGQVAVQLHDGHGGRLTFRLHGDHSVAQAWIDRIALRQVVP